MPPSRCGARGRLEDDRNGDAPRAPLTHRYALARYARAQAELGAWRVELLALDFIFDRAPRSETWEGWGACTVVSAGRTDGVAAARAARARGAGADAIIASSPAEEVLRFVNLHLADAGDDGDGAASSGAPPRARLAMTHDYNGIPFGPFTRRARRKRAAHRELLAGWTLLCDSRHLAEYVRRESGPANWYSRCRPAGGDRRRPRATTAPHLPPWAVSRLRPLLRAPERAAWRLAVGAVARVPPPQSRHGCSAFQLRP